MSPVVTGLGKACRGSGDIDEMFLRGIIWGELLKYLDGAVG